MREELILSLPMVVQANFRKQRIYKTLLSFANLDGVYRRPLLES